MQLQKAKTQALPKQKSYYETIHHLFEQLLDVLILLDQKKIMHRDLKPDNVIVTSRLELKLLDFGHSKHAVHAMSLDVGTLGFQAPEIFLAQGGYENKVDVFAAGVILYQMLFGFSPYLISKRCY